MAFKISLLATVAALLSGAYAVPATTSTDATAATACTITQYSQVSGCLSSTNIVVSNLAVPAGSTLSLTGLKSGTTVTFQGTTTFGYKEWSGPLVSVSGTGVTITGTGTLDGNGPQYWDGEGSNGGVTKPKFFSAHSLDQSTTSSITLKNSPIQFMSIQSDGLTVSGVTFDDGAASGPHGAAHNTDAMDIGSSDGVTIKNCKINNQDDCIAINSGSNIAVSGLSCNGSHGLSIGSVGGRSDNDVSNVSITGSTITNAQNGLRIKTVSGATGSVKNVTWSNVQMSGITDYGIVIQQDYENGSPTGTATNGVVIQGVHATGVTGSVTSKAEEVYVLCGTQCSDFEFSGVSITGGSKGSVSGVTIQGYS